MGKEGYIFDVMAIAKQLYGYKPYVIPDLPEATPGATYQVPAKKERTVGGSAIYGSKDLIGRPVFLPVTIEAGGVNYEFPYCVLAMRRRKIVEDTPMVERGGSVKELIGLEDWKISMKGFLIDPLGQFPDDQLQMLDKVFQQNEPVRIKCALSDLFMPDNDFVVITELDIPEKAKVVGVRDFSFSMVSDSILTLIAD